MPPLTSSGSGPVGPRSAAADRQALIYECRGVDLVAGGGRMVGFTNGGRGVG